MSYNEIDPFEGEDNFNRCAWCGAKCENHCCSDECSKNWIQE